MKKARDARVGESAKLSHVRRKTGGAICRQADGSQDLHGEFSFAAIPWSADILRTICQIAFSPRTSHRGRCVLQARQEPNQPIRTSALNRLWWFGSVTQTDPNHLKQEPSEPVRSETGPFNHGSNQG